MIYIVLCIAYDGESGTAVEFSDTGVFELSAARSSPLTADFYTAARPFTTLFLYRGVVNNPKLIVMLQIIVSTVCWLVLAYATSSIYRTVKVGLVAALLVLMLSLAWPIQSWNYVLLSESLCFSLMALVVGLTIGLFRGIGSPANVGWVLFWAPAILFWGGTRDTVVYSIAILWAGLVAWMAVVGLRQRGTDRLSRRKMVAMLALMSCYLTAVAIGLNWLSERSGRWKTPVLNVLQLRILPDANARDEWIRELGMPDSQRLRQFAGKYAWDHIDNEALEIRETVLDRPSAPGDGLNGFQNWYASFGLSAMRRYLLGHPISTLSSAAVEYAHLLPNRAEEYYREVPKPIFSRVSAAVFFPSLGWRQLLLILTAVIVTNTIICVRGRAWAPLLGSLALAFNSFVQMTVGYHGDAAEVARHTFLASILLRLAIVIGFCGMLDVGAEWFAMRKKRNEE